jgi:hypothetical protein
VDLSAGVGKPRELVLWMQKPEKILREVDHPGESYCGDSVYGDQLVRANSSFAY